ncbi:MAG TPA: hypothetical protein VNX25_06255 [Verrucomicrobiae bacterium]|nr:hypothetical protein [Verrucomicrobiae bacterium]
MDNLESWKTSMRWLHRPPGTSRRSRQIDDFPGEVVFDAMVRVMKSGGEVLGDQPDAFAEAVHACTVRERTAWLATPQRHLSYQAAAPPS